MLWLDAILNPLRDDEAKVMRAPSAEPSMHKTNSNQGIELRMGALQNHTLLRYG